MRKSYFGISLKLFQSIAILIIIIFYSGISLAQWEVKEFHIPAGKTTSSDMVLVGNLDRDPGNEIVWLISDQTGSNRLLILDGKSGEVKWKSNTFFKIFAPSLKIGDIESNNPSKLIFTAQLTSFDPITMYVVSYGAEKFIESPVGKQSPDGVHAPTKPDNKLAQNTDQKNEDPKPPIPLDNGSNHQPGEYLPDNITTMISYSLKDKSFVQVDIFNGTGDIVRTLVKEDSEVGDFQKTWDGTDEKGHKLLNGTYFYTVTVGKTTQIRKPVLFRHQ